MADGILQQRVEPAMECDLEILELRGASPATIEAEARRLGQKFLSEKIDISAAPLFAAKLLQLSNDEHILIVAVDHIVSDAISCDILSRDIWTMYDEVRRGLPSSLPQMPVQFADYAVWKQRTYDAWFRKCGAYWRGRLGGAQPLQLPIDDGFARKDCRPRGGRLSLAEGGKPIWTSLEFPFGEMLSAKLRDMARCERTLLPLIILTVHVAVVSRWCSQRDMVVGFVSHGRHHRPELENMIGFLASFLYLRIELACGDNFLDLLERVSFEFRSAYQHQDLDRVPDFMPEQSGQIEFNWIPDWTKRTRSKATEPSGGLKIQPFQIRSDHNGRVNASSRIVPVVFSDTATGIVMTVGYRSDLFTPNTISRFGHNMRLFAEEIAEQPLASVESILTHRLA
jgi:hypothetical protein